MKITPVTAPAEASDPAHPDHDRWVKDVTLAREMEWAKTVGIPTRVAEAENTRLLELTAKQAKDAPPPAPKKKQAAPPPVDHRGVTRRVASPIVAPKTPTCMNCGRCLICKRNARVMAIFQSKRAGNDTARALVGELGAASFSASMGVGKFRGMRPADIRRMIANIIDSICDRSVATMGPWR